MNSLPPLSLPRFHVNELAKTRQQQVARTPKEQAEARFEAEPEAIESSVETDEESQVAPPVLQPPIDTGAILQSLETALSGLEQSASAHVQRLVSEFITSAFPRLSEAFLTEEVMRELNEGLPPHLEKLILKVPTEYVVPFQNALQESAKLSEISELQTLDAGSEMSVDISWETGGLQFDFQRFLDSSLARLAGPERV